MVSNALRVRYSCRGSSTRKANAGKPTRIARAAAPKIAPEDVLIGQILWNREDHPSARTIVCVREGHCGGEPMALGAYGHPVLVVRRNFEVDDCEIAERNENVLVLGLTSFGQLSLSEWVMSARDECMDALPIIASGSSVVKTGKIASSLGWIKLDGYTLLSLLSGNLYKQSYVLPGHIYSLSISQLAPYQSGAGANEIVRLDEKSYTKVMDILGLQPQLYPSVPEVHDSTTSTMDNAPKQEQKMKKPVESPLIREKEAIAIPVPTAEEEEPRVKLTRKGKRTTISGKGLSKETWALFARLYSSDWDRLRADVAHRKFRLAHLKRSSSPKTHSTSKRLRPNPEVVERFIDPSPVRSYKVMSTNTFTLRQRLRWSQKSWVPMNCRKTVSDFWADLDPEVLIDLSFLWPNEPVSMNSIPTPLTRCGLDEIQGKIPTIKPEISPGVDCAIQTAPKAPSLAVKSTELSAESESRPSPLSSTPPQTREASTSVKLIALHSEVADCSPPKPATLIDRNQRSLRLKMRSRRCPRDSRSAPPVGDLMSFERSMEQLECISSRAEDMGFRSIVHSIDTSLFEARASFAPSSQPVLKMNAGSSQKFRPRERLHYEQKDWERWVAWTVGVYVVYSLVVILLFFVNFVHRAGCGSEGDQLD